MKIKQISTAILLGILFVNAPISAQENRQTDNPDNGEAAIAARLREKRIRSFDRDFTEEDGIAVPGKISKATAWDLHTQATLALEDLAKVPDGENGKGLPDHALLKQMASDLDALATSMNRNEFFQLIPRLLALDSMDKEYAQVLCIPKAWIRTVFSLPKLKPLPASTSLKQKRFLKRLRDFKSDRATDSMISPSTKH